MTDRLSEIAQLLDAATPGSYGALSTEHGRWLLSEVSRLQQENRELLAALFVFGIEPPDNDGEEWSRCTEDGPTEAGATAVEAATETATAWTAGFRSDLRSAPQQEVAQLLRERQVLLDIHDALGIKWGDDPYSAIWQLRAAPPPETPGEMTAGDCRCVAWEAGGQSEIDREVCPIHVDKITHLPPLETWRDGRCPHCDVQASFRCPRCAEEFMLPGQSQVMLDEQRAAQAKGETWPLSAPPSGIPKEALAQIVNATADELGKVWSFPVVASDLLALTEVVRRRVDVSSPRAYPEVLAATSDHPAIKKCGCGRLYSGAGEACGKCTAVPQT